MIVTPIGDPDDARISMFRAVSDPELARRCGLFVAEGRLVVRRLLTESSLSAESLLLTPAAHAALLDALADADVPVFVVPQDVMNRVAGFNIHRGCLALGQRPAHLDWRARIGGAQRAVILEHVGDADNVGAIFRSAAAFGADLVLLGPSCADPLYRKAIRTSMGATLTMPFADAQPWPSMLRELAEHGWAVAAMTPAADAIPLRDFSAATRDRRVAILLGHEGEGLSEAGRAACEYRVRIPIKASVDSLNVATAAAVALYELS